MASFVAWAWPTPIWPILIRDARDALASAAAWARAPSAYAESCPPTRWIHARRPGPRIAPPLVRARPVTSVSAPAEPNAHGRDNRPSRASDGSLMTGVRIDYWAATAAATRRTNHPGSGRDDGLHRLPDP